MRDAERLAKLITIENGKALSDSRGEVAYAAEFFRNTLNFSGQSLAVIGILVRKLLASVSSYSRPKSRSDLREFGVVL